MRDSLKINHATLLCWCMSIGYLEPLVKNNLVISFFLETLFKMGFIEQLVGLLHTPQKSSDEHIIGLLVYFVTDYPQGIQECHRPEFNLKELLTTKITSMGEEDPDRNEVNLAKLFAMILVWVLKPILFFLNQNKNLNLVQLRGGVGWYSPI